MKALDHPNICRVLETYDHGRTMFLVCATMIIIMIMIIILSNNDNSDKTNNDTDTKNATNTTNTTTYTNQHVSMFLVCATSHLVRHLLNKT